MRAGKSDYWDDEGYKHHGTAREVSPGASDDFETSIDELLAGLGGDEYSFSAHMADHHISGNVVELANDRVIRLLLDYRAEYTELTYFFRKDNW